MRLRLSELRASFFAAGAGTALAAIALFLSAPASANQPPVADSYTLIVDKDTTGTGHASGSDPDGDPLTFRIVTRPRGTLGGFTPIWTFSYKPITGFIGTDSLQYVANDGQVDSQPATVTILVNAPPIALAGADTTVTLPSKGHLNGGVTDDGVPSVSLLRSTWTLVSGPASVVIDDPYSPKTTCTFTEPGRYTFELDATDSRLSDSDQVVFDVKPAPISATDTGRSKTVIKAGDPGLIHFPLDNASVVEIRGFDHMRRLIFKYDNSLSPGIYDIPVSDRNLDGEPLAPGIYHYRLKINGNAKWVDMVVLPR